MDSYIPEPERDSGQAVFDAGRGCVQHIGPRDSGDGPGGARHGEGGEEVEIVGIRRRRRRCVRE